MKRLKLANQPEAQVQYKADAIRRNALESLRSFVHHEALLLFPTFNGGKRVVYEDDELIIPIEPVKITVPLVNLEGEELLSQRTAITEVISSIDGTIIARNADGDEWDDNFDISFDDVVKLANAVEDVYNKKIGK